MDWRNSIGAVAFVTLGVWADPVLAGDAWLPDGAYQMVTRLELPHLERYAVDSAHRVCFAGVGRVEPFLSRSRAPTIHSRRARLSISILAPTQSSTTSLVPAATPPERTPAIARPTMALSAASR
jgi:hypothetical protein